MSSVTAILVAYNSAQVIGEALASLGAAPEIAQVIVVDNASSDATCELVAREFPQVTLIKNPKNVGFGCGNNVALEKVTTPFALLINPDAVLEKGALATLLHAAHQYQDAAILAPQLVDARGQEYGCYKKSVFAREMCGGNELLPQGDLCAEYLSGAVWLVNMAHMKKVGFYDPAIFLYYEDDDLCLRVRKAGFSAVLVPAAKCMHLMGESSGKPNPKSELFKQRHMIWSRIYMEQKYKGEAAASNLRFKLRLYYVLRVLGYAFVMNRFKLACYRGRLAGTY